MKGSSAGKFDIEAAMILVLGCIVCMLCTGCSTGGEFAIGWRPITAIDQRQVLHDLRQSPQAKSNRF